MSEQSLKMKVISSLEKCFYDDDYDKFPKLESISMLKDEKLSFQVAIRQTAQENKFFASYKVEGALKDYITVKQTLCVPSVKPVNKINNDYDDNYLRTTPGLYPDLISKLGYQDRIVVSVENLRTLWLDVELPECVEAGEYLTTIALCNGDVEVASASVNINVIDSTLAKETVPHTEWFYTDCIANYYKVDAFSEEHWNLIENFLKTARKNGINTILTPIFTPALDTFVGGERLTTQLVAITLENGEYSFDFSMVDRWVDMCL